MERIKKGMRKTNRVELIKALMQDYSSLPSSASIAEWGSIAENCFKLISMNVYCHKSNQIPLPEHAKIYREYRKYINSDYHCDIQHDIAKLNKDTEDENSLSNTDPMFLRPGRSIFCNDIRDRNIKCIDDKQLKKVAKYCNNIEINDMGRLLSSDRHVCKSSPEFVIEEFFVKNNIQHKKEGDMNLDTHKRSTEYPFDLELNNKKRSLEADWELSQGSDPIRVLVEYFEGRGDKKYREKTEIKRALAKIYNIKLIEVWRSDLNDITLKEKFNDFI